MFWCWLALGIYIYACFPGSVKFVGFVDDNVVAPVLRVGVKLDESCKQSLFFVFVCLHVCAFMCMSACVCMCVCVCVCERERERKSVQLKLQVHAHTHTRAHTHTHTYIFMLLQTPSIQILMFTYMHSLMHMHTKNITWSFNELDEFALPVAATVHLGHDGMFNGKRYFCCTNGHGIFVRYKDVAPLRPANKRPPVKGNPMFPSWPEICKRRKQREAM